MTDTPDSSKQSLDSGDDALLLLVQRQNRMNQWRHKKLRWAYLALLVAFGYAYARVFADQNSVINIWSYLSLSILVALALGTYMAFQNAQDGAFSRTEHYRLITKMMLVFSVLGLIGAVAQFFQ